MKLAYELEGRVSDKWLQARQMGIEHAVAITGPGERFPFWDYMEFARLKQLYNDYGFHLAVLEVDLPFDSIREGTADRDRDIETVVRVIRNAGFFLHFLSN